MKSKLTKVLLLAVTAVALVVVSIMGTMAYLTSSAAVANSFSIGNVGIQMFESQVNADGTKKDANEGANGTRKTSSGNVYNLVPAKTYVKDPTIYVNPSSEQSFLFVKIRNDIRAIEDQSKTMRSQLEANGWVEHHTNQNVIVYVYGTKNTETGVITPTLIGGVEQEQQIKLFETFTIASNADTSKYGGARVSLVAYAIQQSGFVDDSNGKAVDKAWAAIVQEYPYESGLTDTTTTTPTTPTAG